MAEFNADDAVKVLNDILELELAGAVRYTTVFLDGLRPCLIRSEEMHVADIEKMLRRRGDA